MSFNFDVTAPKGRLSLSIRRDLLDRLDPLPHLAPALIEQLRQIL